MLSTGLLLCVLHVEQVICSPNMTPEWPTFLSPALHTFSLISAAYCPQHNGNSACSLYELLSRQMLPDPAGGAAR